MKKLFGWITPLLDKWLLSYLTRTGLVLWDMGGGGDQQQPTTQTVNQTNIPEYVRPYYETLLGQAQGLTNINTNPWQQYGGPRVAGFAPMQQQAFGQLEGMQLPQQTTDASNMAYNNAQQALQYQNYGPQQFQNQYSSPQFQQMGVGSLNVQAPNLQNFSTQGAMGSFNPGLQNFNVYGAQAQSAREQFNPSLQNFNVQGPQMQGAQTGFNPTLQNFGAQAAQNQFLDDPRMQIQNAQMGPVDQVNTDRWTTPGNAAAYMSPYIEQALNPALDQIQRQADLRQRDLSGQAQQAGAFGGYRHGLQIAEEQRNTERAKGDLASQMLNQGYGQAGQLYGTDAGRALQAGQSNQGAALTTGTQNLSALLQSQGLRAQTGLESILANQQAQQQAGLANQAGQYGTQALGVQTGLQTALANQQAMQQAAQNNQQSALQAALANQAGQYGTQALRAGFGAQFGMQNLSNQQQTNLANQQAAQQAALANQAGQYDTQALRAGFGAQFGMQNLSNQQQANLANQQALLGVQQLGAGNSMQAQLANQGANLQAQNLGMQQNLAGNAQNLANAQNYAQFGNQAQQLGEQSRQFGANIGLQGLGQNLQAAQQLGAFGQQQYGQQLGLNQAQQLAGAQQQNLVQQQFANQYQDFLNSQNWPYRNLSYMSDIIGRPMTQASTSMYQAPQSTSQNLLQLGLGAYGLSGMMGQGRKAGGVVKKFDGGGIVGTLPDNELQKLAQQNTIQGMAARGQMQDNRMLRTAAPFGLPQLKSGLPMEGYADGGIVGFQGGGGIETPWENEIEYAEKMEALRKKEMANPLLFGSPVGEAATSVGNTLGSYWDKLKQLRIHSPVGAITGAFSGETRMNDPAPQQAPTPTGPWDPAWEGLQQPQTGAVKGTPKKDKPPPPSLQKEARDNFAEKMLKGGLGSIKRPTFEKSKDAAELYAERKGIADLAQADNPLYAQLQKIEGRAQRQEELNPYVAALAAAKAVGGRGAERKSGIEALAAAAVGGGESYVARQKEQDAAQEKMLSLRAAIRAGDEKTADSIQGQLGEMARAKMQRDTQMYGAEIGAESGIQVALIGAKARIEAAAAEAASLHPIKAAEAYTTGMTAIRKRAQESAELIIGKMGVDKGAMLGAADKEALIDAEFRKMVKDSQPALDMLAKRAGFVMPGKKPDDSLPSTSRGAGIRQ